MNIVTNYSIISENQSLKDQLHLLNESKLNAIPGLALVVDKKNKFVGTLSDGDIRRGLKKGFSLDDKVKLYCNFNSRYLMLNSKILKSNSKLKSSLLEFPNQENLVLIDEDRAIFGVLKKNFSEFDLQNILIQIIGSGFVGLTLGVSFAKNNIKTLCIDKEKTKLSQLKKGFPDFFENGLQKLLKSCIQSKSISFSNKIIKSDKKSIFIVCVGTPLDINKKPNMSYLKNSLLEICKNSKDGDFVIVRSTIPVGSMNNFIIPFMKRNYTGDFDKLIIGYAPERTIQGDAINELQNLPQIVSGINIDSLHLVHTLFKQVTSYVIDVDSFYEAEIIKLAQNTFRDLKFAFSNELAIFCEQINIDAHELVKFANLGYPRDPIPIPSPGVGGSCLSKDSFLYNSAFDINYKPNLGIEARKINKQISDMILKKLLLFGKEANGKNLKKLKILLVGVAFKGFPETSDIRGSIAVEIYNKLKSKKNISCKVFDFVIDTPKLKKLGFNPENNITTKSIQNYDGIFFLNNHPRNLEFPMDKIEIIKKKFFIFDGWNQFQYLKHNNNSNLYYANLGYNNWLK